MTLLDDALRVTAGWPAGRTLLRGNPAALYRDNVGAHLTASTLVVHPDRERVLLCLHPRVRGWVQLGGHAAPVAVARSAATRLEISRGHQRATIRGAGIGAGLGAIGGFVFSGLAASESRPCGSPGLVGVCLTDWYGRAFRGGLIGGAVGALIGAALGYAVRTEVWAGVPLGQTHHLSLAPRGSGLALSLAF